MASPEVVLKLALITFFSRVALRCKASSAESCAVGDSECRTENLHKSGDVMLQIQKVKVNEQNSNGVIEANEVAARTGKVRQGEEKAGSAAMLHLQPKINSTSKDPNWASLTKKDLVPVNPDWIWEVGGYGVDVVTYATIDSKDFEAYVGYPTCSPPAGGFPGLIMLPGLSKLKARLKLWAVMFASHGFVGLVPDVDGWRQAARDGKKFLENTEKYPVDKTSISLMGYSMGGMEVLAAALDPKRTKQYKSFIAVSGIKPGKITKKITPISDPNPLLIIQAQNDGFLGGGTKWDETSGWALGQIAADNGKTKFLAFRDGTHQPMQHGSFFSECRKFLKDPDGYAIPNDAGGIFSSGSFEDSPVVPVSEQFGCSTNDEGIEPIVTFNLWSHSPTGPANCLGACKQVKGCVSFDFLPPRFANGSKREMNCALFSQICKAPKEPGSHWTWKGYVGPAVPAYCNAV